MRQETFRQQCVRLNQTISDNDFTYGLKEYERKEAINKIFPAHPLVSKSKAYCSHCGSEIHVLTQQECPVCHKKWGKAEKVDRASRHREREYLCVMTVMEGLQVMRFWCFEYYFKVGRQTDYFVNEVERQFINGQGERQGFSLGTRPFSYAYDEWLWYSKITIKNVNHDYISRKMDCRFDLPCEMTVIKQTIPMLRRNGLRKSMHGVWYPTGIVLGLLRKPQVESLWKTGQYDLAVYSAENNGLSDEDMASVRICHRNHYRVKDFRMWLDHLQTLRSLGLDTHNAKYVCPKNLRKAHEEMTKRLNRQREKAAAERRAKQYAEQLKRMEKDRADYVKRLGVLLNVSLSGKNLNVRPLQSVDEFAEEGTAMNHCVFSNAYYKKDNCLILSAKDGKGKRLATVEYNIAKGTIEQCRTKGNHIPKRDAEIRTLITSHRQDFERLMKSA